MANVLPFQGIQYNPEFIGNFGDVTTPPYDVISDKQRDDFYEHHPNNIIRLILGKPSPADTEKDNPHTRAAACYRKWLAEGIFVRRKTPALYLSAVDFSAEGQGFTRYGLIAQVGLEPFEKKIILPHERTFSKVKSERLELMKVCRANFSPIFSLYMDGGGILTRLIGAADQTPPEMNFIDSEGHRHRLWRLTDENLHGLVKNSFSDKQLFIADGHHRYETALNYRDWLKQTDPNFDQNHPANYIMMYLCSMNDPGMRILPAHRLLSGISDQIRAELLAKAKTDFDITAFTQSKKGREALLAQLETPNRTCCIGLCLKGHDQFYLLSLKPGVMQRRFGAELPDAMRKLDVTVLTHLILMHLLGYSLKELDNPHLITYNSRSAEAIAEVTSGSQDVAFIMRPTKIEQVQQVAKEGLIMPRKSTYFYPKVITGQVLNDLT
jgi:uncharacterized protein (DUF1015 family)